MNEKYSKKNENFKKKNENFKLIIIIIINLINYFIIFKNKILTFLLMRIEN